MGEQAAQPLLDADYPLITQTEHRRCPEIPRGIDEPDARRFIATTRQALGRSGQGTMATGTCA